MEVLMMQRKGPLGKGAVLFFCSFMLVVAACDKLPFGYTKIGDIVKNPAAFDGKEIQIHGKVVEVTKLPLIEKKFSILTMAQDRYLSQPSRIFLGWERKLR
jgi:hypothetical protein